MKQTTQVKVSRQLSGSWVCIIMTHLTLQSADVFNLYFTMYGTTAVPRVVIAHLAKLRLLLTQAVVDGRPAIWMRLSITCVRPDGFQKRF
jgi:hypothetical protein